MSWANSYWSKFGSYFHLWASHYDHKHSVAVIGQNWVSSTLGMVHQRESGVWYQKKNQCVLASKDRCLTSTVMSRLFIRPLSLGAELGVERNPIKPESLKEELWAGLSDFMCKIGFGMLVQCLLIKSSDWKILEGKGFCLPGTKEWSWSSKNAVNDGWMNELIN